MSILMGTNHVVSVHFISRIARFELGTNGNSAFAFLRRPARLRLVVGTMWVRRDTPLQQDFVGIIFDFAEISLGGPTTSKPVPLSGRGVRRRVLHKALHPNTSNVFLHTKQPKCVHATRKLFPIGTGSAFSRRHPRSSSVVVFLFCRRCCMNCSISSNVRFCVVAALFTEN